MFLGQIRKLRNISVQFVNPVHFFVRPRSPAPYCLLSTHRPPRLRAPHASAIPALPRPRPTDHARPTPTRPRLASAARRPPGPAPQCAPATGPTCLSCALPGRVCRPCLTPPPFIDAWPSEPLRRLVPTPTWPCPTALTDR
jgi:hypothetical protein